MDNPSDYYYKKGLDFLKEENYFEALMYLDKSIELDPDIAVYWKDKAICLLNMGNLDESIEFIDGAMALSDEEDIKSAKMEIYLKKIDALINEDKTLEAEGFVDELMELSPDNDEIKIIKSEILVEKIKSFGYDEDEKLELLDEILELNPKNVEINQLKTGILETKLVNMQTYGFYEENALEVLDELLRLNPDNTDFINKKTEIVLEKAKKRYKQGDIEEALSLWTDIINVNPDNQEYKDEKIKILLEVEETHYEEDNVEECLSCWDQIIELNPKYIDNKIDFLLETIDDCRKEGNIDDYLYYWDKITETDSKYVEKETEFLLKTAEEYYNDEKIDDCLKLWDKIIELNPNNLEYIEKMFQIAYTLETKDSDKIEILKSIRKSFNYERDYFARNKVHDKELESCEKLICLSESYEELNSPKQIKFDLFYKSLALSRDNKFDEAIDVLDEGIKIIGDDEEIKELIKIKSNVFKDKGQYYFNEKNFDDSLKYAEDSLELNEENENAMILKIDSLKKKADYLMNIFECADAINYYDKTIDYINETHLKDLENNKGFISNLSNLKGLCFRYMFKFEEAIECFNEALDIDQSNNIFVNKIETLAILNQNEEALKKINSLLNNNSNEFRFNKVKIDILIRLKRFNEAISFCEKLIGDDFKNERRWNFIRNSLIKLNECSKGIILMDKALNIEKENEAFLKNRLDCLYNFSYELYNAGFTYYALDSINELLEIDNENPNYWGLKGKIFNNLLMFNESKECFDKSLELIKD